jgi:Protein of unknown function (DUF1475)/XK-related protein
MQSSNSWQHKKMNKKALQIVFGLILITMLVVTTWASLEESVFTAFARAIHDKWFAATLFDTYFGFLTFFLWVSYKEFTTTKKMIWFIAIMVLGNIAMSAYILLELRRLGTQFTLSRLIGEKKLV